jgi:2-keto-4-pentenoate hydratase
MFRPFCFETPAEIVVFPGQDASVEAEFAFRFDRNLPSRPGAYGLDEVLAAIGVLVPAIEIVGCRLEGGFAGLGAIRLVADMTAHTAFVSGPQTAEWLDLDLVSHPVSLLKNGRLVAEGSGANVLSGPFSVLKWTANHLSERGESICAGDIVTTGTCTGVTPIAQGDTLVADFGDLGRVELRLTGA